MAAGALVVACEIIPVTRCECLRATARGLRECGQLFALRRAKNERPILGANGVIRRNHAGFAQARQILAIDEIYNGIAIAKFEHEPPPRDLGFVVLLAARPAHNRRNLSDRRRFDRVRRRRNGLPVTRDEVFRARDKRDHALIGFARGFAESDKPVLA